MLMKVAINYTVREDGEKIYLDRDGEWTSDRKKAERVPLWEAWEYARNIANCYVERV
jgi:hypothetical protein